MANKTITATAARTTGTGGNDDLRGTATLQNVVYAGAGNDTVQGGMLDDILVGDSGNDTVSGQGGDDAIWGGGGSDSLDGGAGDDALNGDGGNDSLRGGGGNDTLAGGAGHDVYVVDQAGANIVEKAGEGTDTVMASVSHTLQANIENLTLAGTGNIDATGNALANLITGNSGDNVLDGAGGADTLIGGAGNDTFVVDLARDVVVEKAGEGIDTVRASFSYTLGANVENLTLTGSGNITGAGNALDNVITGNSGVNALSGGAGNDFLDGGMGADILTGGAGDDTYVVDQIRDVLSELPGGGRDTVMSSISYVLGANLENLTLTGNADLKGTGNALANVIAGNDGANLLDGGASADTLAGGAGNDTYVVENARDAVVEHAGGGVDTVVSTVSYTLSGEVENLTVSGASAINGTGNEIANVLTGNDAANSLDGAGGADTLSGGLGNDTYLVDNAGDVVIESQGQGTDTVLATTSFTLAANIEKLTLSGVGDFAGTGNELGNVIAGNRGANMLAGEAGNDSISGNDGNDIVDGGLGNDSLNGGGGKDTVFGGLGNDGLFGGGDNDRLDGGQGNDRIYGDGGNDTISGSVGSDTLGGGQQNGQGANGADSFAWVRSDVVDANGAATGLDHIVDFGAGDRLDFSGLFGSNRPANVADALHVRDVAGGTVVSADVGGGHFVDVVVLDGVHHVTLDDLVGNHQIIV